MPILIMKEGYYETVNDSWGETHLNFCFAYPGLEIGNSVITKIEIATFDSVKGENMEPMYAFMRLLFYYNFICASYLR